MTTEEAIQVVERVIHTESKWPGTEDTVEALDLAIAALRAQAEAEKNDPLTLEELREMQWKPVWVERYDFGGSKYAIVRDITLERENLGFVSLGTGDACIRLPCSVYGRNWLAYRRKPEEDHADG